MALFLAAATGAQAQIGVIAIADPDTRAAVAVKYNCPFNAQLSVQCSTTYVIPNGHRLVLHTINYLVGGPGAAYLRMWGGKTAAPANTEVDMFFGPTSVLNVNNAVISIGNHATLLYFDQMPNVILMLTSPLPFANNIPVTVSGYLVKK